MINEEQIHSIESIRNYFVTYDDGEEDRELIDDNMVHITRQGTRFVFDIEWESDAKQEKAMIRIMNKVDKILAD